MLYLCYIFVCFVIYLLDHTVCSMQWGHQHIVFERALEHLKPAHVLVPHCRRRLADEGDDMLQLLYQLKASVPREQKIHLHYFSGSTLAVEKWCQAYPNAQFGYTTMGLGQAAKEALQTLEPGRLLLETDLPYFKPPPQSLELLDTLGPSQQRSGGLETNLGRTSYS